MISHNRHLDTDPHDPDFYLDPYNTYIDCRATPLFYWEQYGMWCAAGFDLVNTVLRDRRFGRVMPGTENGAKTHLKAFSRVERYSLLNLEPPDHTRLRKLVNQAFVARKINDLRSEIETLVLSRLNQIRPLGEVDLLTSLAMPVPALVIARMLGVPDQHVTDLLNWSHAMVKVYTLTQTHQDEIDANRAAAEFEALLRGLITERRRSPVEDLLSHLTTAGHAGDKLTDDEIISIAILLLNAGHEATVHQFGNAIKTILESGIDADCLFASEEQTTRTVTELMRYDAPLHLFTRFALEDLKLADIQFKAGQQIGLLLGAANRDPQRFSQPEQFNPWRDDGGQLSLGAGIHYCVGALLARLELEIILPMVFRELPELTLAQPVRYRDSYHFHGLEALVVNWQKRC